MSRRTLQVGAYEYKGPVRMRNNGERFVMERRHNIHQDNGTSAVSHWHNHTFTARWIETNDSDDWQRFVEFMLDNGTNPAREAINVALALREVRIDNGEDLVMPRPMSERVETSFRHSFRDHSTEHNVWHFECDGHQFTIPKNAHVTRPMPRAGVYRARYGGPCGMVTVDLMEHLLPEDMVEELAARYHRCREETAARNAERQQQRERNHGSRTGRVTSRGFPGGQAIPRMYGHSHVPQIREGVYHAGTEMRENLRSRFLVSPHGIEEVNESLQNVAASAEQNQSLMERLSDQVQQGMQRRMANLVMGDIHAADRHQLLGCDIPLGVNVHRDEQRRGWMLTHNNRTDGVLIPDSQINMATTLPSRQSFINQAVSVLMGRPEGPPDGLVSLTEARLEEIEARENNKNTLREVDRTIDLNDDHEPGKVAERNVQRAIEI